jgi:hypothetical protein
MYHTGLDPFTGEKLFVEKDLAGKMRQKNVVTEKTSPRPVPSSRNHPRRKR